LNLTLIFVFRIVSNVVIKESLIKHDDRAVDALLQLAQSAKNETNAVASLVGGGSRAAPP
tara:strand:+ start:3028 stop:3207 length:180 start_codon:yes stop_codon:yes gene_type:complete